MDRHARPDDGSPARLIATMVGIVGILLLGSLAWSAVGALFSALGGATSQFSLPRPTPGSAAAIVGTPTPVAPQVGVVVVTTTTPQTTPGVTTTPVPSAAPTAVPSVAATPSPEKSGRAPWVLLPQPAPDTKVAPGPLTIEARGRGDTAITSIRLELDGAALPVALEQRSESTWRAFATVQVGAGKHNVRATVVDDQNRTGGYRWTFDAGP
ncbi:MAG TPA: hypothetical protein VGQ62_17315 [Chloroflexota bacterium]|nr:hypothetical protein [Chloroflexota bacterium]